LLNHEESNQKRLSFSLANMTQEVRPGYGKDGHAFKE
jgi:hypothetical protein